MHLLIALLTVRRDQVDAFRRYEAIAVRVMQRHGGALERAIELEGDGDTLRELHVVRFANEDAFAAYRADPELAATRGLRDASVIATEMWRGRDVSYLPPSS